MLAHSWLSVHGEPSGSPGVSVSVPVSSTGPVLVPDVSLDVEVSAAPVLVSSAEGVELLDALEVWLTLPWLGAVGPVLSSDESVAEAPPVDIPSESSPPQASESKIRFKPSVLCKGMRIPSQFPDAVGPCTASVLRCCASAHPPPGL